MDIIYSLIDFSKRGIISNRCPDMVYHNLFVSFKNAPNGATAIFENAEGVSLYRELENETCSIPVAFLDGKIKVVVTVFNGKADAPKYSCESLFTKKIGDGAVVCPNGIDVPMQILEILSEIQKIKEDMETASNNHADLEKKVDKLLDGYDFD